MKANSAAVQVAKLLASLTICFAAGLIGSVFTRSAIPIWYATLKKPTFTPPNWVFGPAWSALYALMGVSAYLVWRKGLASHKVKAALAFFAAQLVLNAAWSVVFFGLRSPVGGLVVILLLWIAILVTIVGFVRVTPVAGALLVPYILWVSFAGILNAYIVRYNS